MFLEAMQFAIIVSLADNTLVILVKPNDQNISKKSWEDDVLK